MPTISNFVFLSQIHFPAFEKPTHVRKLVFLREIYIPTTKMAPTNGTAMSAYLFLELPVKERKKEKRNEITWPG